MQIKIPTLNKVTKKKKKSVFRLLLELCGFLFHAKHVRNPYLWDVYDFLDVSCTMRIDFPHLLEIVWISASRKIFKEPITLEYLCFSVLFPFYGNSLSSCLWNCIDYWFYKFVPYPKYFKELSDVKWFVVSHILSAIREFIFTTLQIFHMFYHNIFRNL